MGTKPTQKNPLHDLSMRECKGIIAEIIHIVEQGSLFKCDSESSLLTRVAAIKKDAEAYQKIRGTPEMIGYKATPQLTEKEKPYPPIPWTFDGQFDREAFLKRYPEYTSVPQSIINVEMALASSKMMKEFQSSGKLSAGSYANPAAEFARAQMEQADSVKFEEEKRLKQLSALTEKVALLEKDMAERNNQKTTAAVINEAAFYRPHEPAHDPEENSAEMLTRLMIILIKEVGYDAGLRILSQLRC